MSTFGLDNFVTSLQAEKRAKCLARKCLRASLSRLQQRYSSVLVPGNARFESLLGHLSVVTLIGHDYPRTLHLHAFTALQFIEMFVLFMWSLTKRLIRRYRDSYSDNVEISSIVLLDSLRKPKNSLYVVA
jgi:hypothetical protein